MKFSHVGLAVHDLQQAIQEYETILGYQLSSGPFDDPIQNVSVCFMIKDSGQDTIELVAPLNDQSPIKRYLNKGISAYHLCYEVDDINQTLQQVKDQGCIIVSQPVPAVAFESRKIAWFYTPGRQLVEIVEKE